jgi:hypothetical protein
MRVILLGIALIAALGWFVSALRRAPKRPSRWQRLKDLRQSEAAEDGENPPRPPL